MNSLLCLGGVDDLALRVSVVGMELLKQAMLRHEIVFRDQVRELHRLYWTQRSLMMCRSLTEDAKVGSDAVLPLDLLKNQQGSLETKGFGYGDDKEGAIHQNANFYNLGFREINLSTQKNRSVSCKAMHFDLNVAPDGESLSTRNDPVPTVLSSSMASLVIQPVASVNSLAGSQSFISFSRESSTKCSKETSTGVQPVDSRSASKMTINSFQGCEVSHQSGTDAFMCNAQVIKGACDNNQQSVENGHHDSDSDAPLKLQMNSAEVSSNGFGGEIQDNVTGKMLTGILGIEVRNLVLSSGEQIQHAHSAIRQQISNVTSSDNAEDTNLRPSVGSAEQPPAVTRDSENKQANFEGSEEDTLSSHTIARDEEQHDKCLKEIPIESKFDDNEQGIGDVCLQKLVVVPSSTEESGTTQTESYPTKHSLVSQTCRPSIIGKSKHGDEPECDSLIFLAAKTLFSISSHKPECVTDHSSGFGKTELEAKGNVEPQYSSDSFETLTMMLPENTSDEYTMPRILAEKVSRNDACGVKLRRGRGLRDFQKDILPGLSSLSRHEICEDFHSIGHALRKSQSRNRENWPVPVRSRRSRRCSSNKRQL